MQGNPKVNIAVVQMDCVVGEITPNLNKIRHFAGLAANLGADIAIYPECCTTGYQPVVADTKLGKIGMTICYDLIFPEYLRRPIEMGADFIINSTDWIHDGYQRDFWGFNGERIRGLVSTRALENGIVFAMANRVGHEVA